MMGSLENVVSYPEFHKSTIGDLYFFYRDGGSGNGNGEFRSPNGIAISDNGFVYVVDTGNSRIQKFTFDGEYVRAYGIGTKRFSRF